MKTIPFLDIKSQHNEIEFQLVEQRLGHHRQTLTTLMRSIKKAPVSQ